MKSYGIIKMITDKMGDPKHEAIIGKEITYDPQYINKGVPAILQYTEKNTEFEDKCCRTSTIESVCEDSESLTIYTRNSVFYIEKRVDNK